MTEPGAKEAERDTIVRALGIELNALIIAARAVMAEAADGFEPPLSGSAFLALQWLHSFGPSKASRIAESLAMDRSVVSRLMKQLGGLGLIEAAPDDEDGRGVLYDLAEAGRATVTVAMVRKGSLFEKRLEQWPEADLAHLARLLRRLNERS